jgi:predicted acylesterase/phospholipase RssA
MPGVDLPGELSVQVATSCARQMSGREEMLLVTLSDGPWTLCLSGGGFRATFFHLGVLRFIAERRWLQTLEAVFSVSGGSILAAHLAIEWDAYVNCSLNGGEEQTGRTFEDASSDLVRFGQRDVRGRILRRPWHWGLRRRTAALEKQYGKLLGRKALNSLPSAPRFYFLATNLTTGGPFCLTSERTVGEEIGRACYHSLAPEGTAIEPPTPLRESFRLARAVAASSAFPPLFPPIPVSRNHVPKSARDQAAMPTDGWYLADGGVFDNLGTNAAIRFRGSDAAKPIVVSDASAPFDWHLDGKYKLVRRVSRTTDILMHRVAMLERSRSGLTSINIGAPLGQIRTDLNAFTDEEIRLLVWHGYLSAAEQFEPGATSAHPCWDPCGSVRASRIRDLVWRTRLPSALTRTVVTNRAERLTEPLSNRLEQRRLLGRAVTHVMQFLKKKVRPCTLPKGDWQYGTAALALALAIPYFLSIARSPELPTNSGSVQVRVPSDVALGYRESRNAMQALALSRDGAQLAFVARSRDELRSKVYLVDLIHKSTPRPVAGTEGAEAAFFRSDGASLAFVANGDLKKVDLSTTGSDSDVVGTPPLTLCRQCVAGRLMGASWVGKTIVFASIDGPDLMVLHDDGRLSPPRPVTDAHGDERHEWPQVTDDERHLVYGGRTLSSPIRQRVYVRSLAAKDLAVKVVKEDASRPYIVPGYLLFLRGKRLKADFFDEKTTRIPLGEHNEIDVLARPVGGFDISRSGALAEWPPQKRDTVLVLLDGYQETKPLRPVVVTTLSNGLRYRLPRFVNPTCVAFIVEEQGAILARGVSTSGADCEVPEGYVSAVEEECRQDRRRSNDGRSWVAVGSSRSGKAVVRLGTDNGKKPPSECLGGEPMWSIEKDVLFFRSGGMLRYSKGGTCREGGMPLEPLLQEAGAASQLYVVEGEPTCPNYSQSIRGELALLATDSALASGIDVRPGFYTPAIRQTSWWRQVARRARARVWPL